MNYKMMVKEVKCSKLTKKGNFWVAQKQASLAQTVKKKKNQREIDWEKKNALKYTGLLFDL